MSRHLVLLGDSIFDNQSYVTEGNSVIEHLRRIVPQSVRASLLAVDGDVADDVVMQMKGIPVDATHFALSVGGNDALGAIPVMSVPAASVNDALGKLTTVRKGFHNSYRRVLRELADVGKPTVVCTVYEDVPGLTEELKTALSLFNDVITREALATGASVIDLRNLCNEPADYSAQSPIEPSEQGGRKIAKAIAAWLETR